MSQFVNKNLRTSLRFFLTYIPVLILFLSVAAQNAIRVVVVPFEDKVKLNEVWNLGVDVPRWFSGTIDTIVAGDSAIETVPYDSVVAAITAEQWRRNEYLSPQGVARLCRQFNAAYVVSGVIKKFAVAKLAANTSGKVAGSTDFFGKVQGAGGVTLVGGIASYTAKAAIDIDIYTPGEQSGIPRLLRLDSEEKDGGVNLYSSFQGDSDERTFDNLRRTPFGSTWFTKSTVGAIMKRFSVSVHNQIKNFGKVDAVPAPAVVSAKSSETNKQMVEGTVLEVVGADAYVNLGLDDKVMAGDSLLVIQKIKPLLSQQGDTLGWTEKSIGKLKVRVVRGSHFSIGQTASGCDSLHAGLKVRFLE